MGIGSDMETLIYVYGVMMAVIAFLGYITENTWLAITKGFIDNRNMNAPFLLGYGIIVLAIYFLFGTPQNLADWGIMRYIPDGAASYLFYYVLSFVLVSVGEILLGTLVERICGIEYWNYEWIPFHLTKYTSLPTSVMFAGIITFFMSNLFDPIMGSLLQMDPQCIKVISIALTTLLVCDFMASFYKMYQKQDFNLIWKYELHHPQKEDHATSVYRE
ncbi:MAG: putative ABC transporter permease [Lachnospiraceae bacterium]|nr:putative ABC transporter permease [Lachnospiraceae bacterium]